MRLLALVLVTLLAILPPAAAESVGASGECYNADASRGGEDAVEVDTDDPTNPMLPTGTGAANALALILTDGRLANSADGCKRYDCGVAHMPACDGDDARIDYLEAHAAGFQVCYAYGVWFDGRCPTQPHGP